MEKAPTVCEHKHYLQHVLYIITCVLLSSLLSDEQDDIRKLRLFH